MSGNIELLIVGWNRGGLGYVLELLNQAGLDPGYTFDQHTTTKNLAERAERAHKIEVSPYVVPFLKHKSLANVRTVFVCRDPMRVMNSLYYHGMFHSERHSIVKQHAFRYLPTFKAKFRGKPAQASVGYIARWYKLAKQLRPEREVLRVEEGPRVLLQRFTQNAVRTVPYCPLDINSSGCLQSIVPSKLPPHSRHIMVRLLKRLGYMDSTWRPRGGHAHYVNPDWHC